MSFTASREHRPPARDRPRRHPRDLAEPGVSSGSQVADVDTTGAPFEAGRGEPSRDDGFESRPSGGGDDDTIAGDGLQQRVAEAIGQGDPIGRYVVLRRLGAGGMGVVHAAYDPELDRKVAIKLLHTFVGGSIGDEARTRLMREAQALAKLSHPNVVAVYDVGTVGDRVWMAMELVKGQTVSDWLGKRPRPWREVVRVMIAAGEGLWAAHEAGLLHRDFKPDNVMIDESGRVRVMDFGLARAYAETPSARKVSGLMEPVGSVSLGVRVTGAGSLMGTPGYMAPEQIGEEELDARADQFAFGVSLWQALYGRKPFAGHSIPEVVAQVLAGDVERPPADVRVPKWLRRVSERAIATDRAQRFATMRELLDAIVRGQRRGRRHMGLAVAAVAAAVGLGVVGVARWDRARQIAACEAEGASIRAMWDDEAHERVRASLLATAAPHAQTTAEKVLPLLDEEVEAWAEADTRACIHANVEHSWDADTLDRAGWCLEDRRLALESLVAQLSEADAATVDLAIPAVAVLLPHSMCLDELELERAPPPPAMEARQRIIEAQGKLARIFMLMRFGRSSEGLDELDALRGEIVAIGWVPLIARMRGLESRMAQSVGDLARAEESGIEAYMQAAESSEWGLAADTASQLGFLVGSLRARPADGRVWIKHAAVAASFAGDSLGLHEAVRVAHLAAIAMESGSYDEARALGERVLELRRSRLGPEHYTVASVLVNLGNVLNRQGHLAEARQAYEEALAIWERTLGLQHPDLAIVLLNLGNTLTVQGDLAEAKAVLGRAIAIQSASLPADHPDLAMSLLNLGLVHQESGELDEAFALVQRATAMSERAAPQHPDVGLGYYNMGRLEAARGRLPEAEVAYERAVAIYQATQGLQDQEPWVELELARMLLQHGGSRARALELARTAREGLRAQGPEGVMAVAELDALIDETSSQAPGPAESER
jgi:tetratricopeptide (TPR) repeat protein